MKILYIHQHFATPRMPGITRTYEMARRLVEKGHEVHVITTDQNPAPHQIGWYETIEDGIRVHWLPVEYRNQMGFFRRIIAFCHFAIALPAKITQLGSADVLYASSPPLTLALPSAIASWQRKIPLVLEVRDLWPELPIALKVLKNTVAIFLAKSLETLAYRSSTHIVALSPGMKSQIVKQGVPKEKITVIPNCCDHELFKVTPKEKRAARAQLPWLGNRPLVLYAGTIGFANGVSYLVRIAEHSLKKKHPICFVTLGTGGEEAKVRALAQSCGVLGINFFMLPAIPKEGIAPLIATADLNLNLLLGYPELGNSSPNKFFDSLAAGVPVAINFTGWLSEILLETGAGLVLPPKSPEKAAELIAANLAKASWSRKTKLAASRLGRDHFSRDMHAARLEAVLCKAAGKSPIRRRKAPKAA